jgi:hypothetical protein
MTRILTLAAAFAIASFAMLAPASSAPTGLKSAYGIKLMGCNVVQNGNATDGVWVNYINNKGKDATEVDFVVRYNGIANTMTDIGKFSQYAQIQHTLHNAMIGMPFNGETPQLCRVSRVVWADGSVSK